VYPTTHYESVEIEPLSRLKKDNDEMSRGLMVVSRVWHTFKAVGTSCHKNGKAPTSATRSRIRTILIEGNLPSHLALVAIWSEFTIHMYSDL
jgi:hypothetical protein